MKMKRILTCLCVVVLLVCVFSVTAYAAASGDVAGAMEGTWKDGIRSRLRRWSTRLSSPQST